MLQSKKECYFCGTVSALHKHHIFYGSANRKQSERYGLTVWLCANHHNMSDEGVHFNKKADEFLKKRAQEYFESELGTRDEFIKIFGRNYL